MMEPSADDTAEARFRQAVAPLETDARVTAGTGFGGSAGRRIDGRIFAMLAGDSLVVKLPADRVGELLASGGARPFSAGKERPLREWAAVPVSESARWPALVAEAFEFVASGAPARHR
jgi:hypothetical protein